MATLTVNVLSVRKFPHPYPFKTPSFEQAKRNGATFGIRKSEHAIGHFTKEMAELNARGPYEDKEWEQDRLDRLNIFRTRIVSHQCKLAEHRKVLASLPPEE
jgi:hypothetical protein